MSEGRFFYLSVDSVDAIAEKGRADLLAGYMVLAANRQGKESEYTTAGAKAIGKILGLSRSHRQEVLRELMKIPVSHKSGKPAFVVMDTARLNDLADTNYPLARGPQPTRGLPANTRDSELEAGYALVPQTIINGIPGRERAITQIMALPRPCRLPALKLMIHFFRYYDPERYAGFDPRHTAWEAPDKESDAADYDYWEVHEDRGLIYRVIPATSTHTAQKNTIDSFGEEDIFWQALNNLLKIGVMRRSLVVFDCDPTQYGDAELQYILYERHYQGGVAETKGLCRTTDQFYDYSGYEIYGAQHRDDDSWASGLGSNMFVVVSNEIEATPIWVYRPVHDIGTDEGKRAAVLLEEKQAAWFDEIKVLIEEEQDLDSRVFG